MSRATQLAPTQRNSLYPHPGPVRYWVYWIPDGQHHRERMGVTRSFRKAWRKARKFCGVYGHDRFRVYPTDTPPRTSTYSGLVYHERTRLVIPRDCSIVSPYLD